MKLKHRLKLIEDILEYEFRDKNLLTEALTHSSCRRNNQKLKDYEMLEYLGDSVLNLMITDILYREHGTQDEGMHTKLRSAIINNKTLATTVEKLGIEKALRMGFGQKANESILSDMLEAIIGAVYLDGSFHNAYLITKKLYQTYWADIAQENSDYKSQLQEWTQKMYREKPEYQLVQSEGPAHKREFTVAVMVNQSVMGLGKALTKKQAEHNAAKEALEKVFKKK